MPTTRCTAPYVWASTESSLSITDPPHPGLVQRTHHRLFSWLGADCWVCANLSTGCHQSFVITSIQITNTLRLTPIDGCISYGISQKKYQGYWWRGDRYSARLSNWSAALSFVSGIWRTQVLVDLTAKYERAATIPTMPFPLYSTWCTSYLDWLSKFVWDACHL